MGGLNDERDGGNDLETICRLWCGQFYIPIIGVTVVSVWTLGG
jgi:hypothetical protein